MENAPKIIVFSERDALARFVLDKWKEIAENAVQKRGLFAAAVSGGKTPKFLYEKMAEMDLPWEKTHIFLVDERYVPEIDSDSNSGMIKKSLLDKIAIPPENVHFIPTGEGDPAGSARKYESEVRQFFGLSGSRLPEFDLMLLGLGKDGHTASLFPGNPVLGVKDRLASEVLLEKSTHDRITLTLPVINKAAHIFFVVTGEDKAEALRKLIRKKDGMQPAAMVKPVSGEVLVFADSGAGILLAKGEYERA